MVEGLCSRSVLLKACYLEIGSSFDGYPSLLSHIQTNQQAILSQLQIPPNSTWSFKVKAFGGKITPERQDEIRCMFQDLISQFPPTCSINLSNPDIELLIYEEYEHNPSMNSSNSGKSDRNDDNKKNEEEKEELPKIPSKIVFGKLLKSGDRSDILSKTNLKTRR